MSEQELLARGVPARRPDGIGRGRAGAVVLRAGTVALLTVILLAGPASAFYLDGGRNFSARARLYTESSLATQHSQPQTVTKIRGGDVVSHRTFFNPELDGEVTSALSFLGLDEVKFRVAIWGFYDGVYDYLPSRWDEARRALRARFTSGRTMSAPEFPRTDDPIDLRKVYSYQPDPVLGDDGDSGDVAEIPFRINEAYLNLTKGRFSLRLGRQSISWGESDTIALLDQTNPFDLTRGIPGLFQDIDEARIPLWTLRGQVTLFNVWGPLSSGFLDAYLVPGSIDTTVSAHPVPAGVSPYSPPEADPQALADTFSGFVPPDFEFVVDDLLGGIQFTQYDHLPSRTMANSRYGVRLGSLIAKDYTANVWFYRTIAQTPVPRFLPLDLGRTSLANPDLPPGSGPAQIITETVHGLTTVFGASLSFYSPPLNGLIRVNTQYFLDEPAFIPSENVPFEALLRNPKLRELLPGSGLKEGPTHGFVPRADFFRWEIGYDRFFFNRTLNPSNSFAWVTGVVGSWNLSETFTNKDYRFYGQRKPTDDGLRAGVNTEDLEGLEDVGKLRTVDQDFVDLKQVEWFIQSSVQTDYFHGRLTPRLTLIVNPRGSVVLNPRLELRHSDQIRFSLGYAMIEGGFFQNGFYRDRDQVSARVTFLLN